MPRGGAFERRPRRILCDNGSESVSGYGYTVDVHGTRLESHDEQAAILIDNNIILLGRVFAPYAR